MEAKEEIRARLSIEDVVGEYVQLKRAGRNFKGLSPFNSEKTPSFVVSPEKQIWHDFSSNQGGDIFSFIMVMEGVEFPEALRILAKKAGVEIEDYRGGSAELKKKKERMHEMHALAVRFYQQVMIKSPEAIDYIFKKRGFTKETVQEFGLGYAPTNGDVLVQALVKKGYSAKELVEAGLATDRGRGTRDLFRGRIMVPLHDGEGRPVGFTGRILKDNPKAPKYLNTPSTKIYDKGRMLYGFHLAKQAIREANQVVATEGNLDVASSHQAGIKNVVAVAGTALTEFHLKQMARFTSNIIFAFDSDRAGLAATERAVEMSQDLNVGISILNMPEGKDPDDLVREDPKSWIEITKQGVPAVDWLVSYYQKQFDLTTAKGKRDASTRISQILSKIKDPVEKEHYVEQVASQLGTSTEALSGKLTKEDGAQRQKAAMKKQKKAKASLPSKGSVKEDEFLRLAMKYPDVRDSLKDLDETNFSTDVRVKLFSWMKANPDTAILHEAPENLKEIEQYVSINIEAQHEVEERHGVLSYERRVAIAYSLARDLVNEDIEKQLSQLSALQEKARDEGNIDKEIELAAEAMKLHKLLKKK